MKRRSTSDYEGGTLGEVTVKATRVKIAYRGDTITINGKKIDYLTLNGKDFFKGQNKIMLENINNRDGDSGAFK